MRCTVPGLTPNLAAALRTDRPPLRASRAITMSNSRRAALRAANAVVLINFDDLAAHVGGNLAQLTFLVGRGLIDGRNPQIENSAFH